ncbi:hypothetical protein BY996DRAFT_6554271 [Phakopsora pachyrhizi]|nr:hypothetical protein BY996DRAFT_6554271 [Phakopsora pachyrhizi]
MPLLFPSFLYHFFHHTGPGGGGGGKELEATAADLEPGKEGRVPDGGSDGGGAAANGNGALAGGGSLAASWVGARPEGPLEGGQRRRQRFREFWADNSRAGSKLLDPELQRFDREGALLAETSGSKTTSAEEKKGRRIKEKKGRKGGGKLTNAFGLLLVAPIAGDVVAGSRPRIGALNLVLIEMAGGDDALMMAGGGGALMMEVADVWRRSGELGELWAGRWDAATNEEAKNSNCITGSEGVNREMIYGQRSYHGVSKWMPEYLAPCWWKRRRDLGSQVIRPGWVIPIGGQNMTLGEIFPGVQKSCQIFDSCPGSGTMQGVLDWMRAGLPEDRGHKEDGYGQSGGQAWEGVRWQWCEEDKDGDDEDIIRAGGGCGGRFGKGGEESAPGADFEEEGVAEQKLGGDAHQGQSGWSKTTGAMDL